MNLTNFQKSCIAVALLTALTLSLAGCATDSAASKGDRHVEPDINADRPPTAKTLHALARILINQHREAEAEQILRAALQESPTFVPAYADLAELQLQNGTVDAALETLHKGLQSAPQDAVLHNDQGVCYVKKADFASALESFSHAAELDPATPRYQANRAMALGMLGRYDDCLKAYLAVMPAADAHHNLAVLCQLRGDTQRWESELAQAQLLEIDPVTGAKPNPILNENALAPKVTQNTP